MALRNWWIEAEIDGRKTTLSGGPQAKDGGFTLRVFQRDEGHSVKALEVVGQVHQTGLLVLRTRSDLHGQSIRVETDR